MPIHMDMAPELCRCKPCLEVVIQIQRAERDRYKAALEWIAAYSLYSDPTYMIERARDVLGLPLEWKRKSAGEKESKE